MLNFFEGGRMARLRAHSAPRVAFPIDKTGAGLPAILRRKLRALLNISQHGATRSQDVPARHAPDPYFDVWLENRLHGEDR